VEVFDRLGSTNDEVRERPALWRVVVAEQQDAGRGRLGRTWTTTPGTSLAVSVLVPAPASGASWVPLLAGLAVHRAVEQVAGVETALKWPNDVLVPGDGDRKLAGLLCEWTQAGIVVGLGLNVDTARAELPLDTATSLRAAGATSLRSAGVTTMQAVRSMGSEIAANTIPARRDVQNQQGNPAPRYPDMLRSAGVEGSVVVERVKEMTGDEGFNAQSETYENLVAAGVIDPTKVVRSALQHAASVASLLLTTEAVISLLPEANDSSGMPPGGPGGMY